MKDRLFREPLSKLADFEFNEDVAAVFDDMIHRSIPFYREIQSMIVDFVGHFYQRESSIYDLGCSTGSMIAALVRAHPEIHQIIGLDNSSPMIEKAKQRITRLKPKPAIHFNCRDLRDTTVENASVVIMNYTLQFVRPLYRDSIVKKIFQGLNPGGIFILSEKVLEDSTHISRLFIDMYYQFKKRQGYSDLEISQKRERLENVLIPYKVNELRELLLSAGFDQVETFFKWHNFTSMIAIKSLG